MNNTNKLYIQRDDAIYDKRGEYGDECDKCGEMIHIFSQADECPEYYTTVIVPCVKCGEGEAAISIAVN